jgi:3-deoxy-D-manno-octulosonate 8-phosphate phosphatase (KDO 8-P phosphatase)
MGNQVAIITGRQSDIVKRRADELGIQHLFQGIKDKDRVLKELVASLGLDFSEVGAIGDDLNDYSMLKLVGRSFTPKNGVKEIKNIVDNVLSFDGGDGAVREMIDMLVDENNQRDEFMSVWIKEV